jgi:DNA-binding NarL/FixJ family response regulator
MISVLLVDDHAALSSGLRLLLNSYPEIDVVATAPDGRQGIAAAVRLNPDVILMDLSMPEVDGIAATTAIVEQCPDTAIVMLTTFGDRDGILASLDAGAVGYLMKDSTPDVLHDAVLAAAAGGSPIDPRVARTLVDARRQVAGPDGDRLTAKQTQVLRLVAEGLPNRLIARRLGISEKTVKTHLTQIYATLGAADRVQAALWAQRYLPEQQPDSRG